MKIAIATPLYPPDIAEPAPYTKELARRLSLEHEVTIVTYGDYPETLPDVRVHAVSKHRRRALRLARFASALWRAARKQDALILENGPSVEFPASLIRPLLPRRMFLHFGDPRALAAPAGRRLAARAIARLRARLTVIEDMPLERPEVLPLEPQPETALAEYERSWQEHMALIEKHLHG